APDTRRPPTCVGTWRDTLCSDGLRGFQILACLPPWRPVEILVEDHMSVEENQVAADKKTLRTKVLERRDEIPAASRQRFSQAVSENAQALSLLAGPGAIFSIYATMGSEIDPGAISDELIELGHPMCLPVMIKLGQPLIFRGWKPGDALEAKKWGIREPLPQAEKVDPDVLLLPMVAFDGDGWRLGYGGGFYDRTLARLRARKPTIAIGLAFAEQEVDAVPHAAYDERLDLVLTPNGLRTFH
ncbi:MAG: 5-formyltetrahydrofolate cyclo-ligase, partial [Pseudomonadota bacterium]